MKHGCTTVPASVSALLGGYLLALLTLGLVACSDDGDGPGPITEPKKNTLIIGEKSLTFTYDEISRLETVSVETDADDFDFDAPDTWIHVTKADKAVNVKVDLNEGDEPRSGTITLWAGNSNKRTIEVTQTNYFDIPLTDYLKVTPIEFSFDYFGHAAGDLSQAFILTNLDPSVISLDCEQTWVDASIKEESRLHVAFAVSRNNDKENRYATITVSAPGVESLDIEIQQSGFNEIGGQWRGTGSIINGGLIMPRNWTSYIEIIPEGEHAGGYTITNIGTVDSIIESEEPGYSPSKARVEVRDGKFYLIGNEIICTGFFFDYTLTIGAYNVDDPEKNIEVFKEYELIFDGTDSFTLPESVVVKDVEYPLVIQVSAKGWFNLGNDGLRMTLQGLTMTRVTE